MAILERPYDISEKHRIIMNVLNRQYDENIDRYNDHIGKTILPNPALHVSVTNRCNLQCEYCYDKEGQPPFTEPADMTPDIARALLASFPAPSYIFILGGEPLLNIPAVETIMDESQCCIAISTNGQVDNKNVYTLLEKITERNGAGYPTILQISCELGGIVFERKTKRAKEIINRFISICPEFIKIKYTITPHNISSIRHIADWYWKNDLPLEIDFMDGGYEKGSSVDLCDYDWKSVYEFTRDLLMTAFRKWLLNSDTTNSLLPIKFMFGHNLKMAITQLHHKHPIWSACGILGNSVYIGPKGQLFPCHRMKVRKFNYGTVGDHITDAMLGFHQEVTDVTQAYCSGCIWRGTCGGVCPSVAYRFGKEALAGRCKFLGALQDAAWSFIADEHRQSSGQIDRFIEAILYQPALASVE